MVQGAQNQSLAVQVDVGFLGSLGQWIHCRLVQLSRTRLLDRLAELCQSFKESLRSSTRVWIAVMQDYSSARLTKRHAGPKCRFSEVCKNLGEDQTPQSGLRRLVGRSVITNEVIGEGKAGIRVQPYSHYTHE